MNAATQWQAKVLARRQQGRFVVLTVSAPGVADRARPGQYVSASVAHAGLLLRRQLWIAQASASGRDGGALEIAVDSAEPGGAILARLQQGETADLLGPVGRPFSAPRTAVTCLLVGDGSAAATLVWLAAVLGEIGCRVRFCYLPDDDPFAMLDARRVATTTTVLEGDPLRSVAAELDGVDVVYSAGRADRLAAVAAAASQLPHQSAVAAPLVCAAGTCTACVVPVVGRDGVTRMVRSCVEGPVLPAELVRWADLGTVPADLREQGA